jgi:4-diphosphocytidyl-2C-methyl-D-erythritol kinase
LTPSSVWKGVAPAKVNLRLRVLGPREDGYHPVETVLQMLELGDDIELAPRTDGQVTLEVTGVPAGALGSDAENLAIRAATAFLDALARVGEEPRGIGIRLHKRIPHGAGLGGGSSDAAAVLRGMNELLAAPLTVAALLRLAADLGSDVPFFVRDSPRALAWGRGEETLALPALPRREVLVAVPVEPIATAWAYRQLDAFRTSPGAHERDEGLPAEVAGSGWTIAAARAERLRGRALSSEARAGSDQEGPSRCGSSAGAALGEWLRAVRCLRGRGVVHAGGGGFARRGRVGSDLPDAHARLTRSERSDADVALQCWPVV